MDLFKTNKQATIKMDLDKNEQVYFQFYGRRSLRIQMVFFAQN